MTVANCSRTLLHPSVTMKDCLPTRLHSVSRDTEHLNTHVSSAEDSETRLCHSQTPRCFIHREGPRFLTVTPFVDCQDVQSGGQMNH